MNDYGITDYGTSALYSLNYSYYWMIILGAIICLIASARVKSTFKKYSKLASMTGLTGAQAAERMLAAAGITDVRVVPTRGELTDNYNPSSKTVNLSEPVYNSNSVAAIGVACHECGHAIQHAKGYAPITFRSALVPVANIGSTISWPLIAIGFVFNGNMGLFFIQLGIIAFSLAVLFQIVTLPVEFNASARALKQIEALNLVGASEIKYTRKVLKAAAMTYVAGAASAILQLLRLILMSQRRRK